MMNLGNPGIHQQRGAAIMVAIGVTVVGLTIATMASDEHAIGIELARLAKGATQSDLLAHAGARWAAAQLDKDRVDNRVDHLGEAWAQPAGRFPVAGGWVQGGITDVQSRLNLNALANLETRGVTRDRLERLFLEQAMPLEVLRAIEDWVDEDDVPRQGGGAERDYYASVTPAYRPANSPFRAISELRIVRGMTDDLYRRLRRFVSVMPASYGLNVNTASEAVLAAALGLEASRIRREVIEEREREPFPSPDVLIATLGLQSGATLGLTTHSRLFEIAVEVSVSGVRRTLVQIYMRTLDGSPGHVVMQHWRG